MRTSQGSRLSLAGLNDDLTIAQAQRTEAALLSPRARAVRLWILLSLLLEAQKFTIRGGRGDEHAAFMEARRGRRARELPSPAYLLR